MLRAVAAAAAAAAVDGPQPRLQLAAPLYIAPRLCAQGGFLYETLRERWRQHLREVHVPPAALSAALRWLRLVYSVALSQIPPYPFSSLRPLYHSLAYLLPLSTYPSLLRVLSRHHAPPSP